jgi:predicted O-methyltransferase YrrM
MSSYKENGYGMLLSSLAMIHKPKLMVEFGILGGYSLRYLQAGAPMARLEAYDLFEEYEYKHAEYESLRKEFGDIVKKADYWNGDMLFEPESIDLLHIDVSNDGDVYQHALDFYMPKIAPGGLMVLEGGSAERDEIEWMTKYDKPMIQPVLESCPWNYVTLQPFPSLTIITKD